MESKNGNLSFTSGLDTSKLKEDIEKAKSHFKDLSNSAKSEGAQMQAAFNAASSASTDGFKKSTESLKDQIAKQRQLIREISGDIRALSISAQEATNPGKKTEILGDLRGARKALSEEQAALIGLQRQQIEGNETEAESQGGLIGSLGKWAMGLATVAAAMKIGKSIIESTEATAHVFEIGINAASSATGVFFKTVASGDWGNFFSNMDQAIKGAVDYTNKMEDLNNRANQVKISGSKLDIKIGELRQKTYEQADDPVALKKTLTELVTLQREKLTDEATLDSDAYKIKANKIASDNGWNIKDLQQTIEFYSEKKDIIKKGEEYNRLTAIKYKQSSGGGSTMIATAGNELEYNAAQASLKLMREEAAITKIDLEAAGKLADNFSKVTFKERDLVADLLSKSNAATAAIDINNRRDNQRIATIDVQIKKDAIAAAKKAKDDAELDNRIKATQELMKTASGAELAGLAQKLVALENEKKLREDIIKLAIFSAKYDATYGGIIPTVMSAKTGQSVTSKLAIKIDSKEAQNDLVDTTKQFIKSKEKQGSDLAKSEADRIKKQTDDLANGFYTASDAAAQLAKNIGDSNPALLEIINGVGSLANEMGNLVKAGAFTKDGMTSSDAISASISGATQLIGIVAGQAAKNKQVMKDYYANIISQQQDYNLLLNEQLRLNSDINKSVFFKDYKGTLTASTAAFNDAQKKYQDELKKFNDSEAITGKSKVVSGGNVLSGVGAGALAGAGIGTLLGGPVIGTAIGAFVGGLVGLFAKKTKDITAPLLETFPLLITKTGEFDEELAKTLITNKQVTEETAKTLQNLIDWKDKAQKAREQLTSVIRELAGGLGDDLRNSLVDAFKAGTDASKAFGDSVNKTLENIMSNMIFNKVFEGALTQLENDMNASYGIGPDGKPISGAQVDQSWTDDLARFYAKAPELVAQFNQAMTDAQKASGESGFSIFQSTKTDTARQATSKGFAAMSQDSSNELNGRFTAIQGHTSVIAEGMELLKSNSSQMLKHLSGIEGNTAYCRRLEAIENDMGSVRSDMGAVRSGIDTINLKGITLKA